jgi:hypothetical protein
MSSELSYVGVTCIEATSIQVTVGTCASLLKLTRASNKKIKNTFLLLYYVHCTNWVREHVRYIIN